MPIRTILLILLGLAIHPLQAQTRNHKASIRKLTKRIAHVGVLKCELDSRMPYPPKQYVRFDSLRSICTGAELKGLLKHSSPVVRTYAFQALAERSAVDLLPLLLLHQRDTAEFAHQCGCIGSTTTVVESMAYAYQKTSQFTLDTLAADRKALWHVLDSESLARLMRRHKQAKQLTQEQRLQQIRRDIRLSAHDKDDY